MLTKKEWEILNAKDDFEYQGKTRKQVKDSENAICICFAGYIVLK